MSLELWLMFFAAYLLVTLSPGPNVILVLKNSIEFGLPATVITILGNLCCQLIIVSLVAYGVGGLLVQLPHWFTVMKCFGGVYLIYLGIKSFRSAQPQNMNLDNDTQIRVQKSLRSLFLQAFLVSASNPKTLIFLSAFLPQFLDIQHSHLEQFATMYLTICLIVTAVHIGYAVLVCHLGKKLNISNMQKRLAKASGGLFITMGGGVLLSSRP